MRAGIHLNSADPLNGNFDWPQPISKRNGQAGIKSSNREINPFRYPAGCKAAKQFEERLRRYSYHLKRFAFGPDRLAHLSSWLKERLVRTAHRTAAIVGTPPLHPFQEHCGSTKDCCG
jgi:hypothetical protein